MGVGLRLRARTWPLTASWSTTFVPRTGYKRAVADSTLTRLGSVAELRWGPFTTVRAEDAAEYD
jgi:hypothetical protein